jgi:hypothetical protein
MIAKDWHGQVEAGVAHPYAVAAALVRHAREPVPFHELRQQVFPLLHAQPQCLRRRRLSPCHEARHYDSGRRKPGL